MNPQTPFFDARGQSSFFDLWQNEDDETLALGAEACVWCRPPALARVRELAAADTET
jgi:hypothetical protein